MKLAYFRGGRPNFGDDLNPWLWPRLLPGFLDDDASSLFLGIGSIISDAYSGSARKIVFGAAYVPQYQRRPDVHDGTWQIRFVRGPRTAAALNIAPHLAVGDAAILLRTIVDFRLPPRDGVVSFMPHYESVPSGNWQEACRLAGVRFIDPAHPVAEIIDALLQSRLVIAEAMHGAIVADAFRRPWVPVLPLRGIHREKWFDWAEALGLSLRRERLWPSTLVEAKLAVERRRILAASSDALRFARLEPAADRILVEIAARRLTHLAGTQPCLSADHAIARATERMQDQLQALQRDHLRRSAVCAGQPEHL